MPAVVLHGAVVRAEDGRIGIVVDSWSPSGLEEDVTASVAWEPLLSATRSTCKVTELLFVPLETRDVTA